MRTEIVWSGGSRDAAMEMVEDFHARERERKRRRESCNSAFRDEETKAAQERARDMHRAYGRKVVVRS